MDGFDSDFKPDWFSPTGNTIKNILEERSISIPDFAKAIGNSEKYVTELLDGKLAITHSLAIDLARELGSTKEFWIRRDNLYWSEKFRIDRENYLLKLE